MQDDCDPLPTSRPSLNIDPPVLRYPTLAVDKNAYFTPDRVIEEACETTKPDIYKINKSDVIHLQAKMQAAEHEATPTTQDLSDSQYELVSEPALLSEAELANDEASSIASLDDYALDDASSLTGTDLSTTNNDTPEDEGVEEAQVASTVLGGSAFDSVATSQTVTGPSSSTVELKIPYPSTRANSSDVVPVHVQERLPGWSLKYGLSLDSLSLQEPFRIAYCGDEELRDPVLDKLARAVAVSMRGEVQEVMKFRMSSTSIDCLVRLRDLQTTTGRDHAINFNKVLNVHLFSLEDTKALQKFDADMICFVRGASDLHMLSSRDIKRDVFLNGQHGDTAIMEIGGVACQPFAFHYLHPTTGGIRMQTDEQKVVDTRLFRLPVDFGTFSNIKDVDLNKHLAYLVAAKQAAKKDVPPKTYGLQGFLNGLSFGFNENFRGQKSRPSSTLSYAEKAGLSSYFVILVTAVLLGWAYFGNFVASRVSQMMPAQNTQVADLVPNATAVPAFTATLVSSSSSTDLYTSSYSVAVSTRSADTHVAVFAPFSSSGPDSWPAGLQIKVLQANGGRTYLFMSRALQKSRSSRDVLVKVTSGGVQLNASLTPVNETFYELDFGLPEQRYGIVDISVWKEGTPQVTWKLKEHHKTGEPLISTRQIKDLGTAFFRIPFSQAQASSALFLQQLGSHLSSRVDIMVRETALSLRPTLTSVQTYCADAVEYYGKHSKAWRLAMQSRVDRIPDQVDTALRDLRKGSQEVQTSIATYIADRRQLVTRRLSTLRQQASNVDLGLSRISLFNAGESSLKIAQRRAKQFYSRQQSGPKLPHRGKSCREGGICAKKKRH